MAENIKITQTRIVLPGDTNAYNTLFGGKLMSYIDDVSAIAAVKYSRRVCVTASTDSVDFIHPIHANHSVTLESFISGTGKKSMEVFCKVTGECLETGEQYLAATAFATFVVVDKKEENLPIFAPYTAEEKLVHEGYLSRKEQRKIRRHQNKDFIEKLKDITK